MKENRSGFPLKRVIAAALLMMLCLSFSLSAQASQKSKALKAYKSFLAKQKAEFSFSLIYLDKNSVPELILQEHRFNVGYVYTYKNGKVTPANGTGKSPFAYYKKKGILISGWRFGGGSSVESATAYSRLKDGKVSLALADVTKSSYKNGSLVNTQEYRKYTDDSGKYILISNLKSELKKIVGTRKKTKIKYYKNTAANRKKRLR